MTTVRTRFAPSPTGYMHIGGMRTALFNWLWARHSGGQFILRIDDTDAQRNMEEALGPILQAFRWLGMDWDEGPEVGGPCEPYFQSQRGNLYKEALERLLADGKAYRDFDPPEAVKADREAAEKEKRNYLCIRRSLELSDEEVQQNLAAGEPYVVRFKIPREEKIAIDDIVRGHVEWDCGLVTDPVIARGDGSPLYNFATVVDDVQLEITHVIRAEEHLSNTPTQALLYRALGHELPAFAHIPFVTAPGTSKKLSKRDIKKYRNNPSFRKMFDAGDRVFPKLGLGDAETLNPVMVEYYERIGYLPDAVFNSLARIGWSLDDKTEIMSRETIIKSFTLDRVIKSPAGLDPDKLLSFQAHYMGELSLDAKIEGCLPYLIKAGYLQESGIRNQESVEASGGCKPTDSANSAEPDERPQVSAADRDFIGRLIVALDDRVKVFSDILDYDEYFVSDEELSFDEKAFEKRVRKEGAAERLKKFRDVLAGIEAFDVSSLDKAMHDFVESEGIGMGDIIHAVRVAATGKPAGPGMFEALELLGKDSCLKRIDRALALV